MFLTLLLLACSAEAPDTDDTGLVGDTDVVDTDVVDTDTADTDSADTDSADTDSADTESADPPPDLRGLFVSSTTGADTNPGTQEAPFETIGAALAIADGEAIHVAGGDYVGFDLVDDLVVAVHGGYDPLSWRLDPDDHPSRVAGPITTANPTDAPLLTDLVVTTSAPVVVAGVGATLERVTVRSTAVGVLFETDGAALVLRDCDIEAATRGLTGTLAAGLATVEIDGGRLVGGNHAARVQRVDLEAKGAHLSTTAAAEFEPVVVVRDASTTLQGVEVSGGAGGVSTAFGALVIEDSVFDVRYGGISALAQQGEELRISRSQVRVDAPYTPQETTRSGITLTGYGGLVERTSVTLEGSGASNVVSGIAFRELGHPSTGFVARGNVVRVHTPGLEAIGVHHTYAGSGQPDPLPEVPAVVFGNHIEARGAGNTIAVTSLVNVGIRVVGNVLAFDATTRASAFLPGGGTGKVLEGNLFHGATSCAFRPGYYTCVDAVALTDCSAWGIRELACSGTAHNIVGSPGYVDLDAGDVRLVENADAHDAGIDPSTWIDAPHTATDFYGAARPVGAWDIGPSEQ